MDLNRAVVDAVEAIYTAAYESSAWPEALTKVSRVLGSAGACVFAMENGSRRVPIWAHIGIGDNTAEYRAHYAAIDPRARFAAAHPETFIHYDYMLIDERGIDRDEFYSWQSKTSDDLRYFVGCRLALDPQHSAFAAFHWQRKHGHAQMSEIRRFERFAGHIARALTLGNRIGTATRIGSALEAALDGLGCAVALLDRSGRVVVMNRSAESILAADDGLSVVEGRLAAAHSDDARELDRLLVAALTDPPGDSGIGIVRRKSRRRSYLVTVAPLPHRATGFAPSAPSVCVHITDPGHRPLMPGAVLMRLYGLTASEAAIAVRVGSGMSVKQAAGDLEITLNTARVHLHRVFAKTATHRQIDLVQLLRAISIAVPRP